MNVMRQRRYCHYLLVGTALAASLTAVAARAGTAVAANGAVAGNGGNTAVQDSTNPASGDAADTGNGQLAEIVVSAQKRPENLQAVPMTVTAFSAKRLDQANITSLEDLSKLAPALLIGEGTGQATTFIRGVGNPIRNIGDEASVPIFFDDVYYARIPAAFFELNNVQDVEVLEGPQGTLYGRNAEAGLLNVHTKDPGQHTVLDADVGFGSFDTFRGHIYAATPLTDNLALDVAGIAVNQGKGWGTDVTNGTKNGFENIYGGRSKLIWTPGAGTEIKLAGDYMSTDSTDGLSSRGYYGAPTYVYGTGTATVPVKTLPAVGFYDTQGYYPNIAHEKGYTFSGQVNQDIGALRLTSITAYRRTTEALEQDSSNTPANIEVGYINDYENQFSQELRLASHTPGKLKWLVGFYYLSLTGGYPPLIETGGIFGGLAVNIASKIGTKSYSGFGQADYQILPRLTVTLGGRYTSDTVSGSGSEYYTVAATGAFDKTLAAESSASTSFHKFTYKAALNYALTDDVHAYGTISTGFKAGTYPSLPFSATVVPPETLTNYELGLRSELFDHRLRFNLTGFYERVKNYQVQVVNEGASTSGLSIGIASAPRVHSQGVEASVEAVVTPSLTLDGAMTAMQAKYDTFENAPFYTTPSAYGAGYVLSSASADGKYLSRSPKMAFNLGATYKHDMPIGLVTFNANWKHTSTYYWDPDNFHPQSPVDLVDANIKLSGHAPLSHWWVQVWVKNLLDKEYYWGENETAGGVPGVVAPPRTFGATLGYKL